MEDRILVINQDESFLRGLKYSLEEDGYIFEAARTTKEAMDKIRKRNYSLMILDLVLPKAKGLHFCQTIREVSNIPIIVLIDDREDMKKILVLEYGADDYIIKPFNILVLKAKIKAILRRINMKDQGINNRIFKVDNIIINTLGRKLIIDGKNINLTGKEFDLFYLLVSNPNRVLSREELLKTIWGYEHFGDLRTVDVHIRRLREKIETDPDNLQYIHTKWGVGYYFKSSRKKVIGD